MTKVVDDADDCKISQRCHKMLPVLIYCSDSVAKEKLTLVHILKYVFSVIGLNMRRFSTRNRVG